MSTTSSVDPIDYILQNLRHRDKTEIEECGHDIDHVSLALRLAPFVQVWSSEYSLKPAAVMAFSEQTPRSLHAALLATEEWPHVARQVFRSTMMIKGFLVSKRYERAEARTMEGHEAAIRFLEHCGFALEARLARYGKTGRAFLQYAWRLDDHLHEVPASSQ